MLCLQGMLHRLDATGGKEEDPKNTATERAKQLHGRYRAFMTGDFGSILTQEQKGRDKGKTQAKGKGKQKRMGGSAANSKEEDPTQEADTIISYIRDGTIGNATTAIMSYGVPPVNEDTMK